VAGSVALERVRVAEKSGICRPERTFVQDISSRDLR
jgi:hypothetical protein